MQILINNESGIPLAPQFEEECVQLVTCVLICEQAPDGSEVSVTFVTSDEIAELNAEYRAKPEPTDVLSFTCDHDATLFDSASSGVLDTEGEPLLLGDIVISPEVAAAQKGDLMDALRLLLVHGILHLLGYDHEADDEAELMEERQNIILEEWRSR